LRVGWFSCGCSSLVACKVAQPDEVIYIHVTDQHPDTLRFLADARVLLGRPITVLQSMRYANVGDVIVSNGYINGPSGARCTLELKKRVRQDWEREHWARHTYLWGFDVTERSRARRTVEAMPEFDHEFPLIDRGLTKEDCHALCEEWGIRRPEMYDLGLPNNNCICCVKGSKGYYNRMRELFPEAFARRAREEREVGHSCLRGTFLDELNPRAGRGKVVVPDCSLACTYVLEHEAEGGQDG